MILKRFFIAFILILQIFAVQTVTQARELRGYTVAWYDCRSNDGSGSYNSSAEKWTDLSGRGNHLTFTKTGDTYWFTSGGGKGLRIAGKSSNVTYLPEAVVDAVNGEEFTIEFFINNVNDNGNNGYMSIIGSPTEDFAIYKIKGARKIYIKKPGTKTFINRPFRQIDYNVYQTGYGVAGHHSIITANTTYNALKWYLDGGLVLETEYNKAAVVEALQLLSEEGNSVLYQQIKVLNVSLTKAEAEEEYAAYKNGTF